MPNPSTLIQEIVPYDLHLLAKVSYYESCPESKDTKVLIMYNIFNLQKRHCE